MAGVQSCSCVQTQVPSSFSFHSLAVRPAEYDPGLATLTLRVLHTTRLKQPIRRSNTKAPSSPEAVGDGSSEPAAKSRTSPLSYGEVRVVHGSADVHRIVASSVDKFWGGFGDESDQLLKDKAEDAGESTAGASVSPEGFWCLQTGEDIEDRSLCAKFVLDMFRGLCSISWEIISSCSLTHSSSHPQMYEMFTWILKKQVIPVTGADCVAISVRLADDNSTLEVIPAGDGPNVEVNNILQTSIRQNANESGEKKQDGRR